jgi:heme oxygenase
MALMDDSSTTDSGSPQYRGLGHRLRSETAALHRAAEKSLGIPDAVSDRFTYANLLISSLRFYSAAQSALDDARFAAGWARVGVVIAEHDRTGLLREDLGELDSVIETGAGPASIRRDRAAGSPAAEFDIPDFASALGWLYVIEGSSLGGRFIAPAILERIGEVPVRFYRGDGRAHPAGWRAVQAALARVEQDDGDADAVVSGATAAFGAFGDTVSTASSLVVR